LTRRTGIADLDAHLDDALLEAIALGRNQSLRTGSADLPLYDVLAYHLGFLNSRFEPVRMDAGKRIRPKLCALACEAAGGNAGMAIHTAAAIELLHNFTLLHDDIQDQSPIRRHRDTVWSIWGIPQAINAGDAMFSLAHLALNRSIEIGVPPATVLSLSVELHQTTLRIVEGQVLDLGFEDRADVTVSEYLTMISGKTAAICRYACWAGATVAGSQPAMADALADFGFALGIGFQLRDDLLGVWGDQASTGKASADDIRRRKKSLPILVLLERASPAEQNVLGELYALPELSRDHVERVLQLMKRYDVQEAVQGEVSHWHGRAVERLNEVTMPESTRSTLAELVRTLVDRLH
jgi:geranylgeranyl diphosphate synthase, type I